MDFFRKLFGFSDQAPKPYDFQRDESSSLPFPEEHSRSFDDNRSIIIDSPNRDHRMNFNVFTDPLEMHRYFEQQMDNFFKHFGMPNFGQFFQALEQPDLSEDNNEHFQHPRDEFIKKEPSYERPKIEEKIDKDLDGKLSIKDLDTLFQSPRNEPSAIVSRNDHTLNKHFGSSPFFNQSVQMKTIRKPDGSYETYKTVRDSEGNEETTITRKIGDKEYTVVKKQNREGKEEIHETMINMNENEKCIFDKKPFFDGSIFDKFFK